MEAGCALEGLGGLGERTGKGEWEDAAQRLMSQGGRGCGGSEPSEHGRVDMQRERGSSECEEAGFWCWRSGKWMCSAGLAGNGG